jgi:hypothetical protein
MDTIILIDESNVTSHRSGVRKDYGLYGEHNARVWTLLTLDQPLYEWPENKEDSEELRTSIIETAEEVSGADYGYYYGGPGRIFCEVPGVRLAGRKVLVTQFRGLDI